MYCVVCEASVRNSDSSASSAGPRALRAAAHAAPVSAADADLHLNNSSDSSSRVTERTSSRGRAHCATCLTGATAAAKACSDGDFQGDYAAKNDSALPGRSRSDRVMVNFRELLWYWREYYLRRGRDRLSIEFSSHIPFFQWNSLVGKCPSTP